MKQVQGALERLKFWSEVSTIAKIGARKLEELLRKLDGRSRESDLAYIDLTDHDIDARVGKVQQGQSFQSATNWVGLDIPHDLSYDHFNPSIDCTFPIIDLSPGQTIESAGIDGSTHT